MNLLCTVKGGGWKGGGGEAERWSWGEEGRGRGGTVGADSTGKCYGSVFQVLHPLHTADKHEMLVS